MTSRQTVSGLSMFVAAVQAGGFAAAGRRLGVSSSAVGKAVARLENRLGVVLLQRSTRSIALTGEGELLFARSSRLLEELRQTEGAVATALSVAKGWLKISMPTVLGRRVVIPRLSEFVACYPDVQLDISLDDRVVDVVGEGYDVALRTGDLVDSNLVGKRIGRHRFVVCASPGYLAAHGEPLDPIDIESHQCLRFRYPSSGQLESWSFLGLPAHKRFGRTMVFNDSDAILAAALAGLGIAQLPDYAVASAVAKGQLRIVLANHGQDRGGLWIVWPPARRELPRIQAFSTFLSAVV